MRRADRLFQIVQLLRRNHVVTAARLAAELEVSVRTVYRDIADLSRSGVPIEAEAGVGYRLRGYDLPPLMFDREEIEALVLGVRIVGTWTDPDMARAARRALSKVESVLPESSRDLVRDIRLFAPGDHFRHETVIDLADLRHAVREKRRIRFAYRDQNGATSQRTVRPFGLAFYGPIWVLASWCELRSDYRAFRPDRMSQLEILESTFIAEDGPCLEGFLDDGLVATETVGRRPSSKGFQTSQRSDSCHPKAESVDSSCP